MCLDYLLSGLVFTSTLFSFFFFFETPGYKSDLLEGYCMVIWVWALNLFGDVIYLLRYSIILQVA